MPKITALDPKTNQWVPVEDELDVTTGKSLARQGLTEAKIPFKVTERLIHKKTREPVDVPEEELKEALSTGEFDIEALSEAKGEGYEKAQVEKFGDVGPGETAIRKFNPLFDETEGAIESPTGALKAAANYVGASFDESAPDLKAYRDKTELQRAREDRGEENNPGVALTSSILGGVATPAISAAGKVGRIAAGAAEGLGFAAAADEDSTVYNKGNLSGAALGAALPAAGVALETTGEFVKGRLAAKGEGRGANYLDNPELLQENIKAGDRAKDIQSEVQKRNQGLSQDLRPIEGQISQTKLKSTEQMAARAKEISKLNTEVEQSIEQAGFAKGNIKTALEEFKRIKTEESRQKLNAMLKSYDDQLKELGSKRDARFEELEAFPATEEAKSAYRNLRADLQVDIGEMEEEAAIKALRELEKFMPEEGLDVVSQGQLLKKMKRVSAKLYEKVKTGPGYGTGNFNRSKIAAKVNDAFKNAGDKPLKDLTEAMAEPVNNQQFVRAAATNKVPELVNGRNTKVYSPDPMKAETAKPETVESLKKIGYDPAITKELSAEEKRLNKEIEKLEFRTKILKSGRDSLKKQPPALSKELLELQNKKRTLQERAQGLNSLDNGRLLNEVDKVRDIDALYGRQTGPEAAAGAVLDVGSMVLPAGVQRVGRKGLGAITDPVRQIEQYNKVREVFNKPALTAMVKQLTLGGRSLTRAAIKALSEQHEVDEGQLTEALGQ